MAGRLVLLAALVGLSAAWQSESILYSCVALSPNSFSPRRTDCDRYQIREIVVNRNYHRIEEIDFKARESVAVFSVKGCKNQRVRMTVGTSSETRGFNVNIDEFLKDRPLLRVMCVYRRLLGPREAFNPSLPQSLQLPHWSQR